MTRGIGMASAEAAGRKTHRRTASLFAGLGLALVAIMSVSCATPIIPEATTPDLATIPDGRYRGSYDASIVKASVEIEVAAGTMRSIDISSHDCSPIGKKAEAIVERVLEAQSLSVDVVAGATASSKTLLKAMENALTQEGS